MGMMDLQMEGEEEEMRIRFSMLDTLDCILCIYILTLLLSISISTSNG